MPQTEFDIVFRSVLLRLSKQLETDCIRIGKRVGDRYQDVSIHLPHENSDETRPIVCIEVKKETTSGLKQCLEKNNRTRDLELSVRQALGYAQANHYVRHGIQVRPVCMLLDNKYMTFLDVQKSWEQNLEDLLAYPKDYIFETTDQNFKELFPELKGKTVESLLGPDPHTPLLPMVRRSQKDEGTCDNKLAKNLMKTYGIFRSKKIKPIIAIDYTIQCFLLAILRNCGFISVYDIDYNLANGRDIKWLVNVLEFWFSNNFETVSPDHISSFIEGYNSTRTYDVRVDAMPQESLGYAYEKFIHHAKDNTCTEFYTPDLLIQDVVREVKPTVKDILFDPTCGCGSFLIGALRHIFPRQITKRNEIKQLSRFLTNNVYGNDRDFYATCITKAAILSFFVEVLGIDPTEEKIKLPTIKQNITTEDYFAFTWPHSKPPTVVIGNAPWGDVSSDSKNFKTLIGEQSTWAKIMAIRDLGDDRHELSGSVVLKGLSEFSRNRKFRMGMLVKQQLLVEGKDRFLSHPQASSCYFFDYGPQFLFAHTTSLTACAFFSHGKERRVESKFATPFSNWLEPLPLKNYFSAICKGQETGRNEIWKSLAQSPRLAELVVKVIDSFKQSLPLQVPTTINVVYLEPPGRLMRSKKTDVETKKAQDEYRRKYELLESELSAAHKAELDGVTTGAKKKGKKTTKSNDKYK